MNTLEEFLLWKEVERVRFWQKAIIVELEEALEVCGQISPLLKIL